MFPERKTNIMGVNLNQGSFGVHLSPLLRWFQLLKIMATVASLLNHPKKDWVPSTCLGRFHHETNLANPQTGSQLAQKTWNLVKTLGATLWNIFLFSGPSIRSFAGRWPVEYAGRFYATASHLNRGSVQTGLKFFACFATLALTGLPQRFGRRQAVKARRWVCAFFEAWKSEFHRVCGFVSRETRWTETFFLALIFFLREPLLPINRPR